MKIIVQRSLESSVCVDNNIVGHIDTGMVLLVGFTHQDTEEDIDYMVHKVLNLRIFDDVNGKMNHSILEMGGSILSISQFTLYGDVRYGNRPSYVDAMSSNQAETLYRKFNEKLAKHIHVEKGIFGADMKVSICNDGPVTIVLESR